MEVMPQKRGAPLDHRTGIKSYRDVPSGSIAEKAPYIDHGTARPDPRRSSWMATML